VRPAAAIEQALLPLVVEALEPAIDRALADAGGRGRRRHRPVVRENPLDEQLAAVRTGLGVTVDLHPVSSLEAEWLQHLSASQGGPDVFRLLTDVFSYS
jgi:hypothetical protein